MKLFRNIESASAGHLIILNYNFENIALDMEYCERELFFLENEVVKR